MRIGIPRNHFYYDCFGFIQRLFDTESDTDDIEVVFGPENDEEILGIGTAAVGEEACQSVKLALGQVAHLMSCCEYVFIPMVEKDFSGRRLCPELVRIRERFPQAWASEKLIMPEPLNFRSKLGSQRKIWTALKNTGMKRGLFMRNFENAYAFQKSVFQGSRNMHIEAAWEFVPQIGEGEIILPNTGRILLAGHCYNVYDSFVSGRIMKKLDELGFDAVTERSLSHGEKVRAVDKLKIVKTPMYESVIRTLGTAMCLDDSVDGVIYLSSFSCKTDLLIIDMIRKYTHEKPLMIITVDEPERYSDVDTRLEMFAEIINERKRAS